MPDEVSSAAPRAAVDRLAERLQVTPEVLAGYAVRDQTRTDHLREIAQYSRWRPMDELERRDLAYAGEGAVRRRHHEQQTEQMWCLTLATNAIVTWSTEYFGLAVTALWRGGRRIDDDVLTHIWPSHHENVHFYGPHTVDVDRELAALDTDGYRPLCPPPTPSERSTAS